MPISLRVNGAPVTVEVPGEMPLLWVVRDVLNLTGKDVINAAYNDAKRI